ncbi:GntR family transcriptional regulator [Streptomyces candidus]|uniref:GntR family transcriptional regulator n=1 Tax=Streptomyces candidus TaxID=67283 RepID=A0A7X0HMG2_9ACTN|nr:GntR family transcriptional regulator [Streptomyces candidus]MBB6438848.1 GntR family transcriptional regulator [Streptomyces candidus]
MAAHADASRLPIYLRVAAQIHEELTLRHVPPGERLPSERSLAAAHRASRETIRQALHHLREQGIVATDRSGSYVLPADDRPAVPRSDATPVFPGGVVAEALATACSAELLFRPAPTDIARVLGLTSGVRTLVHRQQVTGPAGDLIQRATTYFSRTALEEIPQLARRGRNMRRRFKPDLRRLYQWMDEAGLRPVCEETLTVTPPPARAAGTADLRVRRIVSDQLDRPLEVTDLTITAGSGSLNYRFSLAVAPALAAR